MIDVLVRGDAVVTPQGVAACDIAIKASASSPSPRPAHCRYPKACG